MVILMIVHVDDLFCVMKDPRSFLDHLIKVHKYELKGDEPLSFHLGCAFGHDPNGKHNYQPKKYNRKISMIFPLVSCCSCVNIPSSS